MRCHLLNGKRIDHEMELESIVNALNKNSKEFRRMPIGDIVAILDYLGRDLIKDPECQTLDGISYISMWLRRSNLERVLKTEYDDPAVLDGFIPSEGMRIKAQPRGLACHWVANNVTTLGIFSVLLAILSKNSSLVKASLINKDHLLKILAKLDEVRCEKDGRSLSGAVIAASVAVVTFEGRDINSSSKFSQVADIKVVWGGAESVAAISSLPSRSSCELILFGPKYSLGVMDREFSQQKDLALKLRPFARDVMLFDQMACSSPQVLFVEKGGRDLNEVAAALKEAFQSQRGITIGGMAEDICAKVINARGRYLLDVDRNVVSSHDLSWTILIDNEDSFPDPVHGRCLFLRSVDDLDRVSAQITHNVQAVELLFTDEEKMIKFSDKATAVGADRIILSGGAHDFSLPWDGMKVLNRMVRWVTIR